MPTETANYGFTKDNEDEFYNVNTVNANLDKIDTEMKRIENTIPTVSPTDSVKWLGTVTGTANTLTVTHAAITSYSDGLGVSFAANANSSAAATLNINSLGAIPIKKANGTAVTNLKVGGVYTLRYSGSAFILQGEGGTGNAQPKDVRTGKTFTNDDGEKTGTLVAYAVGESIPIEKIIPSNTPFVALPLYSNYGAIFNGVVANKTPLIFDWKNGYLLVASGVSYKTYNLNNGSPYVIAEAFMVSGNPYVHAFDNEHGILYVSLDNNRISKRSVQHGVYWTTTDAVAGNYYQNSVAHIPGNQGVAAFQGSNPHGIKYNTDGTKQWNLSNAYVGYIAAICASKAGDVYIAVNESGSNPFQKLYKFSSATGARTDAVYSSGSDVIKLLAIDETNQRLVLVTDSGMMSVRKLSDMSSVVASRNNAYTATPECLVLDNYGNIYVASRGGGSTVSKFSPTLDLLWKTTNTQISSVRGFDINRAPYVDYPDVYVGNNDNGYTHRFGQRYDIKA